jgi:integrase/recombinase XerD
MSYPSLKLKNWPNTDRTAWEKAIGKHRLLDRSGIASKWRPATQTTNIHHYGRWLAYRLHHEPRSAALLPGQRVDFATLEAYLSYLEAKLAPVTIASSVSGLACMMAALDPQKDWAWLRFIANGLSRRASPVRDKRPRLRPIKLLFDGAISELQTASLSLTTRPGCLHFRNALMIGILSACPIRLRNFAALATDVNLRKQPTGWRVQFPASEVKNHQSIDLVIPDRLAPFLEIYLDIVVPALANSTCKTIWPNVYGHQMSEHALYMKVMEYTKNVFDVAINPHLFRDCAATSMSTFSIRMAHTAGDLLGHASFATTEKYYIHAQRLFSTRRVNSILSSTRSRCGSTATRNLGFRTPANKLATVLP